MKTFPRCSCRSTWSCYMTGEKICCTVPVSCLPKDTAFDFILEQMYYWSCASQLSWTKCQPAMVITVGSDFSGLECLSWACGNLWLKWETVNVQLFFFKWWPLLKRFTACLSLVPSGQQAWTINFSSSAKLMPNCGPWQKPSTNQKSSLKSFGCKFG